MELTKLYGVDLDGFLNILKENDLDIDCVLKLIKSEIDALQRHYDYILSIRDTDDFNPDIAIKVQNALSRKKEKLDRYILFLKK